ALGSGRPFVTSYVIDLANVPGKVDGVKYSNIRYASSQFLQEFKDFTPRQRDDPGLASVFHTADDAFTAHSPADMGFAGCLDEKAAESLKAVQAGYAAADQGKGAFRFVDAGGDVTMQWADTFEKAGDTPAHGADKSGNPNFGYADFDADQDSME